MKTCLYVGLTIWLTLSVGWWLIGFAFAGKMSLPALNLFTSLILYAPPIVFFVTALAEWRLRKKKLPTDA